MAKTYTTQGAAKKIGVSFRTLNRWLALGTIKRPKGIPYGGGRMFWLWTNADIARGWKVKATQQPGPKPKKGRK